MIHPIEISEKMIPRNLLAYPELIHQLIRELGEEARNEILRLAMVGLHTSFDDYAAGVQPVVYHLPADTKKMPNGHVATIELVGMMPNMIEEGWAGGDMKPFLLAGRNSKPTKDGGRYNVVPFRHMGPGTTGRNGQPMGSQYAPMLGARGAEQLGKQVYKRAMSLRPGKRLAPGTAPILKPHHATDLYAGMVRERKTYAKATQPQYKTFRAVSSRSDPSSWIHPGIKAHGFFAEAQSYVDRAATAAFRAVVGGL